MSETREYQTDGVVIKKTRLGEADRILTIYTRDYGKIQAVAKGVRRPKSKLAGHLELLTYSQVRMARGRNLDTIIGSQTIDAFLPVKNDLWLTSLGLYAAELVNQFNPEHAANQAVFRLFVETLSALSKAENSALSLRYFEIHLLELAGFRPQLRECVSCRAEIQPEANYFCPTAGGILCPDCRYDQLTSISISVDALKVMRFMQKNTLETINRLKISDELANELKNLLAGYIRYILEKEVRSATWLDNLRVQLNPPTI